MHTQDHLAQGLVLMAACKEVAGGEEIRISLLIPALEDFCQYIVGENARIISSAMMRVFGSRSSR